MVQVFMRRVGESLIIGDKVDITVLSIRDDEVRLAVATSQSVPAQMRVFKTRLGESLVIDDEVDVIVLSARDGEVRLEVAAPTSVSIHAKRTRNGNHSEWIA